MLSKLVGAFIVCFLLAYAVLNSGEFAWFIDFPSLAIVLSATIGLSLLSFGFDGLFVIGRSFRVLCVKPQPVDMQPSTRVMLRGVIKHTYAGGVLGVIMGIILVLQNMGDPSKIGPAIAIGLLTMLYAVLIAEFLFRPALNTLRYESEKKKIAPLPPGAFPVVIPERIPAGDSQETN